MCLTSFIFKSGILASVNVDKSKLIFLFRNSHASFEQSDLLGGNENEIGWFRLYDKGISQSHFQGLKLNFPSESFSRYLSWLSTDKLDLTLVDNCCILNHFLCFRCSHFSRRITTISPVFISHFWKSSKDLPARHTILAPT